MYTPSPNGNHINNRARNARGRTCIFRRTQKHASCSNTTWHPQPQNHLPKIHVDRSANTKKIPPALTIPFLTNSMPSEGSMGVSVFPPNQLYCVPMYQRSTCAIISTCTVINTVQRFLARLPIPRTGSETSDEVGSVIAPLL